MPAPAHNTLAFAPSLFPSQSANITTSSISSSLLVPPRPSRATSFLASTTGISSFTSSFLPTFDHHHHRHHHHHHHHGQTSKSHKTKPRTRTVITCTTAMPPAPASTPTSPSSRASAHAALKEYVDKVGGKRVIKKILIANNGMAATKAILSLRQWAYIELGNDQALEFIAMATPEDLEANVEYIRLADSFVQVPAGPNRNNYANVDVIINIALRLKVDAVWPGWGHASEKPDLSDGLAKHGIMFIGPTGSVMSSLGDKISANILAQTARVPSIPWSGDGVVCEKLTDDGRIPQDIFNSACIKSLDEAIASANKIGYPVMLKASEGGGGKGIRMSANQDELVSNYAQVCNEVPGSPIFMMQLCNNARHIEVQIVGDEEGNAVALNGRDCSTQRRFQKIFEEGPPIVVPPQIFKEMERAAQRLTKSVGYRGAGTVEYLFDASSGKYFFLELNPRLQVEHPVTEGLTGINMPATQLQVAMGIPLYRIPDIRRFFLGPAEAFGTSKIDFMTQDYPEITKHVIAARITAENPDEGFKPTSGKIERVKFQSTPHVWGYFSVSNFGGIHEYADSQFGHIFASGPNREAARKQLVIALKELEARGEIRNPIDYLVQLAETDAFKQNTINTSWLDKLIKEKTVSIDPGRETVVLSAAIFRAVKRITSEIQKVTEGLEKGQPGVVNQLAFLNSFLVPITYKGFRYDFKVTRASPTSLIFELNGSSVQVPIRIQPDGNIFAGFGGSYYTIAGREDPLGVRIIINGSTCFIPNVIDPSELRSDVTGKLIRYLQDDGQSVDANKPYVELEAMKMVMQLSTTEAGIIHHRLSPGSIIKAGDLLSSLELKDPGKVKKITPYQGQLSIAAAEPEPIDNAKSYSLEQLNLVLDGFSNDVEPLVLKLVSEYTDPDMDPNIAIKECILPLINKYLSIEENFMEKSFDLAILDLLKKYKKEQYNEVIRLASSHLQLKNSNALVLSLLRKLVTFPDIFKRFQVSDELKQTLTRLGSLPGKNYGEIASFASQLALEFELPTFESRLEKLKSFIINEGSPTQVSKSRELSLSVDLLPLLFKDSNQLVRKAALEVYVRRVWRAHTLSDFQITQSDSGLLVATWIAWYNDATSNKTVTKRRGLLAVLPDDVSLDDTLENILDMYHTWVEKSGGIGISNAGDTPANMLMIVSNNTHTKSSPEAEQIAALENSLRKYSDRMKSQLLLRSVTVMLPEKAATPKYYTFTECDNYIESPLRRNMRPTFPHLLELPRLDVNYKLTRLPCVSRNAQIWLGVERPNASVQVSLPSTQTVFFRAISHSDVLVPGVAERILLIAMDEIDRTLLSPSVSSNASTRIFIHVLQELDATVQSVVKDALRLLDVIIPRYADRLVKLRVDEIEVKVRILSEDGNVQSLRFVSSSNSNNWLKTEAFIEYSDPITGMAQEFQSLESTNLGTVQATAYSKSSNIQMKRTNARSVGSTYCYDFLGLMEVAIMREWQKRPSLQIPARNTIFSAEELVLNAQGNIERSLRPAGSNDIGMVAWLAFMRSPEYPDGREIVLIANDVTFQAGSFGVKEDEFFFKASEYARERDLPRVYISCNSGARIGLAEKLKGKFKVEFTDPEVPASGFKYLYLTDDDYKSLKPGEVNAREVTRSNGEKAWALDDIIGDVHGIGVENLRGSGMIAGETSRAYAEGFTLSYITGRSVGIGAYLNRLGQRTIQMVNGPMILTGFSALNKLLGRDVYTSQDQLGGPQIMGPNGVSHLIVKNDTNGIEEIVEWLSFIPAKVTQYAQFLPSSDPVDREIDFKPTKLPYDPRHMLAGVVNEDGTYLSGFFDRDTFKEYLAGWGKSVVVGRAKLGGIPMGVISVETRNVSRVIPADPGNSDSREVVEPQAGQVWYPDSAYKTAQALNDFNNGENLPVIIFANWRGFSGGTRDMFGEVLKYGSMIVDALRTYRHPVFIYLPPNSELRGGAWVVLDPTINEKMMEMYADVESRGGILEPPGICEVKFREKDQIKKMHEIDPELMKLDKELVNAADDLVQAIKAKIAARENSLLPIYLQIAHEFADLHDRAGRMKAKGVIRSALEWKDSRKFFFWRVQRRLKEIELASRLEKADKSLGYSQVKETVKKMITCDYDDDQQVCQWINSNEQAIKAQINLLKTESADRQVKDLLDNLSPSSRQAILKKYL